MVLKGMKMVSDLVCADPDVSRRLLIWPKEYANHRMSLYSCPVSSFMVDACPLESRLQRRQGQRCG